MRLTSTNPDSLVERALSPRVLIVDSARDEREMYAQTLRLEGFCTLQARTAGDGYRLAVELVPALAITDARLEGALDGLDLTRKLKLDDLTRHIPVIMLVGAVLPRQIYLSAQIWADQVAAKPCAPESLMSLVKRLLPHAA